MGEARRKGSFDERQALALQRREDAAAWLAEQREREAREAEQRLAMRKAAAERMLEIAKQDGAPVATAKPVRPVRSRTLLSSIFAAVAGLGMAITNYDDQRNKT